VIYAELVRIPSPLGKPNIVCGKYITSHRKPRDRAPAAFLEAITCHTILLRGKIVMRHSLIAFTALGFAFIVGEAALAADLPIEPPIYQLPVRARAYSWTGFYFGGNVGGAWGHSTNPTTVSGGYFDAAEALAVNAVGAQVTKSSGYIAGGQAGFNWQAGGFLAGVEADFNYFGLRGSSAGSGIYPSRAPAGFQITTSISTDCGNIPRPLRVCLGQLAVLRHRRGRVRLIEGRLRIQRQLRDRWRVPNCGECHRGNIIVGNESWLRRRRRYRGGLR
jgi:hypothetical protein